jgi:prepilin-type processing-associated H-X9-DG protein
MVRVLRVQRIAAAIALVLLAAGGNEARAEDDAISIGTELMATADVTLHKAEIARGSKVSVTKLNLREGKVDSVNVALADGHVVKMPLAAVRSYFRVVTE